MILKLVKRLYLVLLLALPVTVFAQNNYIIFRPAGKKGVVRIYIDRCGNIYPSKDYVDSLKFGRVSRKAPDYADLRAYFTKYDTAALQQVLRDNNVPDFDALQSKLLNACASEVNRQLRTAKKLVVLIHGFNEYASLPYDTLETAISKHLRGESILYLEVYWDGLKAYTENPGDVFKIWFRANRTAPYAAMALRKLFAKIDDADLYIITHSLGACVGTRLLFNTNEGRRFPYAAEWKKLPTPHQSSITLAMLAPAITGKRVFKYLNYTVPANSHNYKRVVVGYNKYDYATTKSCRFPLSRIFHSTSLGCNPSQIRRTGRVLARIDPILPYRTVDFTNKEIKKVRIHHISSYTSRQTDFDRFLSQTFD